MAAHKVKLEICGSSYILSTNDAEEYLLCLADKLDKDMNQVMIDAPNASITQAAIITALAYLDKSEKDVIEQDRLRSQIQTYLEDAAVARKAYEDAKKENEKLMRELAALQVAPRSAKSKREQNVLQVDDADTANNLQIGLT
jgi:cell division protein ZapA